MPNHTQIKLRRGTAAEWQLANELLLLGEPGFEKDTYKLKIGDGVTLWNDLPYVAGGVGGSDGPLKYTYDTDFESLGGNNTNYSSNLNSIPDWMSVYTEETGFTQDGNTGNDFGFDSNGLWFLGDAQPSEESYPVRTNFDIPSDSACEVIFTVNHNHNCSDQGICFFKNTDSPQWSWGYDTSRIAVQINCPRPMIGGLNETVDSAPDLLTYQNYYTFKVTYTPLSSSVVVKIYAGQDTSGELLETLTLNERLDAGTDYRIGFAADQDGDEEEDPSPPKSYFTNVSITVLNPIVAIALTQISNGIDFSGFFQQLIDDNETCSIKITSVDDSENFAILKAESPTFFSGPNFFVFSTTQLVINYLNLVAGQEYYINIDIIGTDTQSAINEAFNTNLISGSGISFTYNGSENTLTIASSGVNNPSDNRVLTSDGTNTGINAESALTFDGDRLRIDCACPSGTAGLTLVGNQKSTSISSIVYSDPTEIETEDGILTVRNTSRLVFLGTRGTEVSPSGLEVDDTIGIIRGDGYNPHGTLNGNGVVDNRTSRIRSLVSASGTHYLGSSWEFCTSSGGSGIYDKSMVFDHNGNLSIDGALVFPNNSTVAVGTYDNGTSGNGGVSLNCTVGYELNWQGGRLKSTSDNGATLRSIYIDSPITYIPTVVSLSFSTTISIDPKAGEIFDVTLTDNVTIDNPSNAANDFSINGKTIRFRITQDGTGGRTVGLGNKFVIPSSASSPLPWSTTANSMDILAATYHAGRDKWDIVAFVPGY